jgi:hypothetical protein
MDLSTKYKALRIIKHKELTIRYTNQQIRLSKNTEETKDLIIKRKRQVKWLNDFKEVFYSCLDSNNSI